MRPMMERMRAYVLFAVWGGLLAILGPFCIALTALTRIPEFVTIPTMCTIRLGLLLAGVRYSIEGRDRVDPRKTYVYVSNHQSTLDPPMIWLALGSPRHRIGYLFKSQVEKVPLLATGAKTIGMIAVDRSNRDQAVESVRRATESLKRGQSFGVFAEGTRTRTGELLPLKKGAFHMAVGAGVPIVPVTIDGAFEAMPPGTVRLRSVPIRIVIHHPIPTISMTEADVDSLLEQTRAIMAAELEKS
ncbi:MAG: lysophospholipid acyltransferase family protein [Blastocatellia bacterium]